MLKYAQGIFPFKGEEFFMLKSLPLPALKYTKVILNPRAHSTVDIASPCRYTLESGDLVCVCPDCHEPHMRETQFHSHPFVFGEFRTVVYWHVCQCCGVVYYRISYMDILSIDRKGL